MAIKSTKDLELRIKAKNDTKGAFKDVEKDIKNFADRANTATKSHIGIVDRLKNSWSNLQSPIRSIGSTISTVFTSFKNVSMSVLQTMGSIASVILEIGAKLASMAIKGMVAFVSLNAEFEHMKATLDIVTRGKGEEWFNRLNRWALDMPISMGEVVKSFTILQAYGLKPSIKLMETLIDTASVLPDSGRAIAGIGRAIGQIQAKGRLEGQELRQLAEWAVPGYEAVYTKMFLKISKETGKTVDDLTFTMVDADTAIKALLETMNEHFGGAARKISKTWSGLMIRLTNYTKEFVRQVGESGAMGVLKTQLEGLVGTIKKSVETGEFQKIASMVGDQLIMVFSGVFNLLKGDSTKSWADTFVSALKGIIYTVMVLKEAFLILKGVWLMLKFVFLGVASLITNLLYGIISLISQAIKNIGYFIKMIPDRIPGATAFKDAYASVEGFVSDLAESQYDTSKIIGQLMDETAKDIKDNAKAIVQVYNEADKAVNKLTDNLTKFHQAEVKSPTITGDVPTKEPQTQVGDAAFRRALAGGGKEINGGAEDTKYWDDLGISIYNSSSNMDKFRMGFASWIAELEKDPLKRIGENIKAFMGSIQSGFSDVFDNILKGNMNLADSFTAMGKVMREAFFKVAADMLAEWIITKTAMLVKHVFVEGAMTTATVVGTTGRTAVHAAGETTNVLITAAAAIKRITINAWEAASGAFVSMVKIPFIGPILGAAAAVAAVALVLGFAKNISGFEKGTGLGGVKDTGPAILHKGEIVLNKKESDAYRAGIGSNTAGSNTFNLSFNISSMDSEDMERVVRKKVIPLIRDNIKNFGKGRTMVREAMS